MFLYVKKHIHTVHKYFGHNSFDHIKKTSDQCFTLLRLFTRKSMGRKGATRVDFCWKNRRPLTLLSLIIFAFNVQSFAYNGKHTKQKNDKSYICLNLLPNNHLPNVATSHSKRLVGSFEWIVAIGLSGSCDCWVSWVESHLNSLGKESAQLVWLSSRLSSFQGCHFKHHHGCWMWQLKCFWWSGKMAELQDIWMAHPKLSHPKCE